MLQVEHTVATNDVQWPHHSQSVIDYWGTHFSPVFSIVTGFKQRSFLHVCNAVGRMESNYK